MKDVENSSKVRQGSKTKETEHLISRCKNFAHLISRGEFLSPKGAIFAHLKTKVRNLFQGAKNWFQSANSLKAIFAHHCSRCENFRTVRNPLLAHECQFRTPQASFRTVRNSVRKFRTPLFKVRKFRTPNFKVWNLQTKVRKFRTVKF